MAKTLGQQLDDTQAAIDAVLKSQSHEENGKSLTRADLATLYRREEKLLSKIEAHGRNYIAGQNLAPMKRAARVQFT